MSDWPSTKARRVFAALLRIGWQMKRQSGSHRTLARDGWPDYVFAFHDGDEIGPKMLARIAKHTGPDARRSLTSPQSDLAARPGEKTVAAPPLPSAKANFRLKHRLTVTL